MVIKQVTQYIKTRYNVTKIIVDPRIENKRAIRCYEKCGFKIQKLLKQHEYHEGSCCDHYLMVLDFTGGNDEND